MPTPKVLGWCSEIIHSFIQQLIIVISISQVVMGVQFQTRVDKSMTYNTAGQLKDSTSIGRFLLKPQVFSTQFSTQPQVLITFLTLDFPPRDNGFLIEAESITATSFNAKITALTPNSLYAIWFSYFAVVDNNIEIYINQLDYRITGLMPPTINIPFRSGFRYIPQVALFVNGVIFTIPPNRHQYFESTILLVNQQFFQVSLCNTNCARVIFYQLTYIAGLETYLLAGMAQSSPAVISASVYLTTLKIYTKAYSGGIAGMADDQSHSSGIRSYTSQVADELILNYTLSYFQYIPCIGYCNYCIDQISDQCNQCVSTSFRSNPPQCKCQQSYYQDELNIICQPCQSQCLNCIQASVCISCQPLSMTINPPSCQTCVIGMYLLNNQCLHCPSWCTPCTSLKCLMCNNGCLTCNLISCLDCKIGYYLSNDRCQPCPQYCQVCNEIQCLVCIPSTYMDTQNQCIQCISPCQSCSSKTECLSCISLGYFIDAQQQCVQCDSTCLTCNAFGCLTCYPNYKLNSSHQCIDMFQDQILDCSGMQAITTQACLYVNCSNGVWDYGEQCNNNSLKSGCFDCQISPGYICNNAFLKPSYCITMPKNCIEGEIIGDQVICKACQNNYLLEANACLECAIQCLGCNQRYDLCTTCRFLEFYNSGCQLCESQAGFYSDYKNNKCHTICGDGILAGHEQCDYRDEIIHAGCYDCQIVSGYTCNESSCNQISYPTPLFQEITTYPRLYNNPKMFSLTYDVPIITNITLVTQIEINSTNFSYVWSNIDNQTYNLLILFKSELISTNIVLKMLNDQIFSEQGFSQQIDQLSLYVSDYLIISQSTLFAVNATSSTINYIFIIFIVILGLAIIFGGLATLFNLLDILQIISYFKYFNTQLPYNLEYFLNIFNYFKLPNLPIYQFYSFLNIGTSQFIQPPQPMLQDEYSCSIINNFLPILNFWTVSFLIYLIAIIIQYFTKLAKFKYEFKLSIKATFIDKSLLYIIKYLFTKSNQIVKSLIWTSMIRIFQSSSYDINFMIMLAIYGFNQSNTSVIVQIDQIMTILIIFGYSCIFYGILIITNWHPITILSDSYKYGAISEGIKIEPLSIYYNIFILIMKIGFMTFLVLLFHQSLFQITGILICSLTHVTIINILDPIRSWHEKTKQNICAICLTICQFFILILIIDDYIDIATYYQRDCLGWLTIVTIMIIIITQLFVDSYQQLTYYYNKYRLFRQIITRIRLSLSFNE